jgi:hypothetical protein
MGRYLDLSYWLFISIMGVFISQYTFKIVITPLVSLFILIIFAGIFLSFIAESIVSESAIIIKIFDLLLVAFLVFLIILPVFSENGIDRQELSMLTGSIIPEKTQSETVQRIVTPPVNEKTQSFSVQTTTTAIEYLERSFQWTYGGRSLRYTINIPKPLYDYYRNQVHDSNYSKYALSRNDRKVLDRIITSFEENADSKTEAAYNVVAFVQSLPYFKDDVSTGYDNYARYPIETLVDNGGDCEDTAILTAALLKEMNYDVVLINPPGHMAIGITCSDCSGISYTHDGKKYYYLETTERNWKVGQMPDKYKNTKAKIYSL